MVLPLPDLCVNQQNDSHPPTHSRTHLALRGCKHASRVTLPPRTPQLSQLTKPRDATNGAESGMSLAGARYASLVLHRSPETSLSLQLNLNPIDFTVPMVRFKSYSLSVICWQAIND